MVKMQPIDVDANKVIAVLRDKLSETELQRIILEVALADSRARAAALEAELAALKARGSE